MLSSHRCLDKGVTVVIQDNTDKAKDREMHPLQPFPSKVIHLRHGSTLRISALGYARLYPAIDLSYSTDTPSGRVKTVYIGIDSDNFMEVFLYLLGAARHWGVQEVK